MSAPDGEHVPHQLMQAPEPLSSVYMALLELLNHWRNRAHWIDVERRAIGERLRVYRRLARGGR